ncbi:MAG: hypothetical protein V1911_00180 [Candidatus Micrarchaeota archaeon]
MILKPLSKKKSRGFIPILVAISLSLIAVGVVDFMSTASRCKDAIDSLYIPDDPDFLIKMYGNETYNSELKSAWGNASSAKNNFWNFWNLATNMELGIDSEGISYSKDITATLDTSEFIKTQDSYAAAIRNSVSALNNMRVCNEKIITELELAGADDARNNYLSSAIYRQAIELAAAGPENLTDCSQTLKARISCVWLKINQAGTVFDLPSVYNEIVGERGIFKDFAEFHSQAEESLQAMDLELESLRTQYLQLDFVASSAVSRLESEGIAELENYRQSDFFPAGDKVIFTEKSDIYSTYKELKSSLEKLNFEKNSIESNYKLKKRGYLFGSIFSYKELLSQAVLLSNDSSLLYGDFSAYYDGVKEQALELYGSSNSTSNRFYASASDKISKAKYSTKGKAILLYAEAYEELRKSGQELAEIDALEGEAKQYLSALKQFDIDVSQEEKALDFISKPENPTAYSLSSLQSVLNSLEMKYLPVEKMISEKSEETKAYVAAVKQLIQDPVVISSANVSKVPPVLAEVELLDSADWISNPKMYFSRYESALVFLKSFVKECAVFALEKGVSVSYFSDQNCTAGAAGAKAQITVQNPLEVRLQMAPLTAPLSSDFTPSNPQGALGGNYSFTVPDIGPGEIFMKTVEGFLKCENNSFNKTEVKTEAQYNQTVSVISQINAQAAAQTSAQQSAALSSGFNFSALSQRLSAVSRQLLLYSKAVECDENCTANFSELGIINNAQYFTENLALLEQKLDVSSGQLISIQETAELSSEVSLFESQVNQSYEQLKERAKQELKQATAYFSANPSEQSADLLYSAKDDYGNGKYAACVYHSILAEQSSPENSAQQGEIPYSYLVLGASISGIAYYFLRKPGKNELEKKKYLRRLHRFDG